MLDLNTLQLVQAVAQSGSFTGAAAQLGYSKTKISLQIKALEQRLGVALFRRTTRQVSLTRAGEHLLTQCLPLYQQLQAELQQLQQADSALSGPLVLTAPEDFIREVLAPVLLQFSRAHPALQIELRSSDHVRDLVKEGIDVAFRGGWLRDSTLSAQRLGSFAQWLLVSPQFLARHAADQLPSQPADLQHWPLVAFSQLRQPRHWTFVRGQQQQSVQFSSPFIVSSTASLSTLLQGGAGIGVMTDYAATPLLKAGTLVRLLPDWQLPSGGTFAVYPPGRQRPLKVRRLVEAVQQHLTLSHAVAPTAG